MLSQVGCNNQSLKSKVIDSSSQATTGSAGGGSSSQGENNSAGNDNGSANNPVRRPINNGNSDLSSGKTNKNCQISTTTSLGVITISHDRSQVFFESSEVVSPAVCKSQSRKCTNGFLSGSYTAVNCSVKQSSNSSGTSTSVGNSGSGSSSNSGSNSGTGSSSNSNSGSSSGSGNNTSTENNNTNTGGASSTSFTNPILLSHLLNQNTVADSNFSFLPSIDAEGKYVAFFGDSPKQTIDKGGAYSGGVIENLQTGQRRRIANVVTGPNAFSTPCAYLDYHTLKIQMTANADKILFNDCLTGFNVLGNVSGAKLDFGVNNMDVRLNYDGTKVAYFNTLNKNIFLYQLQSNNLANEKILNARPAGNGISVGTNWLAYCDDPGTTSGNTESKEIYLVQINTFETIKLGKGFCRGLQVASNDSQFLFTRSSSASVYGTENVLYDINARKFSSMSANESFTFMHLTADGKTICAGLVTTKNGLRKTEIKLYSVANKSITSTGIFVDIHGSLNCSNNANVIVFDSREKFLGYTYPEGGNDLQVYMVKRK